MRYFRAIQVLLIIGICSLTISTAYGDYNWPVGPPPGAKPPGDGDPKPGPLPNKPPKGGPNKDCGSIIGCELQTLGEVVNVTGTPLRLHYQSDRVPGRRETNMLKVRLSGASLPPGLQRIHLEIAVAGQAVKKSFAPQPNLVDTFTWDGKDAYGRTVQGQQPVKVRIGFEYVARYYATVDSFEASFNRFGSPPIAVARGGGGGGGGAVAFSILPARTTTPPIILWQDYEASLGILNSLGLGGWSLSAHHVYDVGRRTLYLGSGDQRSATAAGVVISTVAGTGTFGFAGDGGPATQAQLNSPEGVATASDGSVFIVESANNRVRRVGSDGTIITVADQLNFPQAVAVGSDGSLYIADAGNHRIRRVAPDGIITTVAGTEVSGFLGDGGAATQAQMAFPTGVAAGSDGSLYITDNGNDRIRRVGSDGLITTVAGTGDDGFAGDGALATQARLSNPFGIAAGSDGSLYIADTFNARIRRVGPDGVITTVAGTGVNGFAGDGGPATQARLSNPRGVAVGSDGSLYVADSGNERIRRVGPDGVITTVAGTGSSGLDGDGGYGMKARLISPRGVAVGADGSLYIAESGKHRIRQLHPALPGPSSSLSDIFVTAEDGSEIFHFNETGRHLRTLDCLTGAVRFQFTYTGAGRLATVSDGDGNVTTIERDGIGNPSAIVAPFGQRTNLAVHGDGYLSRVTNPAGEAVQFTYNSGSAEGLLTTLTDPRGNVHRYEYDTLGRLIRDEGPAGGVKVLARTDIADDHYSVSLTTSLGLVTTYEVEELLTGDTRRVRIDPGGARTEMFIRADGSRRVTYPDGTVEDVVEGPDPRFDMQAPVLALTRTTPAGLVQTITRSRTATLANAADPLSLQTLSTTLTINGRASTSVYQAGSKTLTMTSPGGRQTTATLDARGRVVRSQVADLEPVTYSYDVRGRLTDVSAGVGPALRTNHVDYGVDGRLASRRDPMGRSTTFTYDAAGRISSRMPPGGDTVGHGYDPNGNMSSLTPPGRTAHTFGYTAADLEASYAPPDLPSGATPTTDTYDTDRRLTRVLRPDGGAVDLAYDAAGRLDSLVLSNGLLGFSHDAAGRLAGISAPGGLGLAYDYDGGLLTSSTAVGTVSGSVGRIYDTNFRLSALSLNGANPVSLSYDADNLLTQVGNLGLTRDNQRGLVTDTTLGVATDSRIYNGFAELTTYTASTNGTAQLTAQYTRDALGRITAKTETLGGVTDTYVYTYNPAGQLAGVRKNGAAVEAYTYDPNGNRVSATGPGGIPTGVYDVQDRLNRYGATTYTYTAAGELATKTTGPQTYGYSYDQLGNLLGVKLPGGAAINYLVDGQNRRIGKQVNGAPLQGFLYEDGLRPMAELDGAGVLVSRFIYATHLNVPDYLVKGGVTYRIFTDHQGSPRLVVNTTTGAIAQRMDYDSFGNVLIDTHPGFQPFGYAGGLYDGDTKLVRFGLRDYDAATGRWTTKDPIGFAGGQANLYAYVRSDPINATDASGSCEGDYKKCRDKFLDNYFGEESRVLADLFSFQSAIGQNGSELRNEYIKTAIESGVVKGGALAALNSLARALASAGPQGASATLDSLALSGGLWAQQGIYLFAEGAAAFGVGVFSVTTTMDALATYECWNAQF